MASVWKEATRWDLKDLRTGEPQKSQHTSTGKHNEPFETSSRNWKSFPLSILEEGPQFRLNRLEQFSPYKLKLLTYQDFFLRQAPTEKKRLGVE